jgi:enoyl-CoA hydratase/carnithine racemase
VERRNAVGIITLNRPHVLNAWHWPMREEFIAATQELENDDVVRAIILTGAGNRAFCAGQDLNSETDSLTAGNVEQWVRQWERVYGQIRSLTKPSIAALNGAAVGSAFHVAMLCDFRIAHPEVRLGQPEIDSAIASVVGPWIMREMLGFSRMVALTLTGSLIYPRDCSELFHQIVAPAQVMPEAFELACSLAQKPRIAMQINKRRLRELTDKSFTECMEAALRYQRQSIALGGDSNTPAAEAR